MSFRVKVEFHTLDGLIGEEFIEYESRPLQYIHRRIKTKSDTCALVNLSKLNIPTERFYVLQNVLYKNLDLDKLVYKEEIY